MAVDETSLERIRKATFPASRRGYDKREVEKFLNRLADWLETGGGDQARSDTVRRELERVGQRTGAILSEAEESAQQIRGEAEQEMAQLRADAAAEADLARKEADAYAAEARAGADSYSKETRAGADAYAKETRGGADQEAAETRVQSARDAHDTTEAAEAQARRTVDEGVARRKDIEAVIGDLAGRRDLAIGELESLRIAVEGAISDHKPSGADPFALPDELDPLGPAATESGDEERLAADSVNGEDAEAGETETEGQIEGFEEFDEGPADLDQETGAQDTVEAGPEANAVQETEPDKKRGPRRRRAISSKGKR